MRNTKWIKDNLFAHRGLHNHKQNIPENSLLAFRRAFDKGYGIEFDLHYMKDKSLIIFHDNSLMRLAKVDLNINESKYEDLNNIVLLNSQEHIPLLTELLDILPKATPMLIEFKSS
ncbi:MAG: glycerophosphodiester phosphodiesterase, partial [Bacilli bacterium]|nr:glycerophosphodiester phosphodiesterase [Bacilli bacterium]